MNTIMNSQRVTSVNGAVVKRLDFFNFDAFQFGLEFSLVLVFACLNK